MKRFVCLVLILTFFLGTPIASGYYNEILSVTRELLPVLRIWETKKDTVSGEVIAVGLYEGMVAGSIETAEFIAEMYFNDKVRFERLMRNIRQENLEMVGHKQILNEVTRGIKDSPGAYHLPIVEVILSSVY